MKDKYAGGELPPARPRPGGVRPGSEPCAACAARVLSVCNAVGDDDLLRLAAITVPHEVEERRTFVNAGDPAEHFFNITEGVVKIYRLLPDGRQQIIGFLFAGDFLGLATENTYAFSAEAVTPVRYCRFTRKAIGRFLEEFPKVEKRLLTIASNELAAAQEQMVLLGRKTAREKVASFLMLLSRRMERLGKPDDAIELKMSRQDIGDYLGLTTETVSRTLTQFRSTGLIDMPKTGLVRLRDRAAMAELSEGVRSGMTAI
jgi:CRP/FNR family transcriptional regulator, anaerobic regulatory protein